MSNAFIQASGEINFADLPTIKGRAFMTLPQQVLAADLFEQEHSEATVIRPWENADQHKARLATRKPVKVADPELSVPPHIAQRDLRMYTVEIEGLPLDHPKYDERFEALVRIIHQLQDVLNLKHTRFVKGQPIKKADPTVPPEMVETLAKYKALPDKQRRTFIDAAKNPDLLAAISSVEVEPTIQQLAIERIGQLAMKPVEPVK